MGSWLTSTVCDRNKLSWLTSTVIEDVSKKVNLPQQCVKLYQRRWTYLNILRSQIRWTYLNSLWKCIKEGGLTSTVCKAVSKKVDLPQQFGRPNKVDLPQQFVKLCQNLLQLTPRSGRCRGFPGWQRADTADWYCCTEAKNKIILYCTVPYSYSSDTHLNCCKLEYCYFRKICFLLLSVLILIVANKDKLVR